MYYDFSICFPVMFFAFFLFCSGLIKITVSNFAKIVKEIEGAKLGTFCGICFCTLQYIFVCHIFVVFAVNISEVIFVFDLFGLILKHM